VRTVVGETVTAALRSFPRAALRALLLT